MHWPCECAKVEIQNHKIIVRLPKFRAYGMYVKPENLGSKIYWWKYKESVALLYEGQEWNVHSLS